MSDKLPILPVVATLPYEENLPPVVPTSGSLPRDAAGFSDLSSPARLAALTATGLLDTPAEERFDRLTRLAARLLKAPIALLSLVDDHRQFFKSAVGLPEPWDTKRQTPLTHSFCKYVAASGEALQVDDARHDPRVCASPAITDLGVVAYAGVPLLSESGETLGSFCVIDTEPREWTDAEMDSLRDIAAFVGSEITLLTQTRESASAVITAYQQTADILESIGDAFFALDDAWGFTYVNAEAERLLQRPRAELLGRVIWEEFPEAVGTPLEQETRRAMRERTIIAFDEPYEPLSRWFHIRVYPSREGGLSVYFRDITLRHWLDEATKADLAHQSHIADSLQEALFPILPQTTQIGRLSVATFYEAALEEARVGGDFIDVFPLPDGRIALVVGDVSGKGLASAIHTAEVKFALRAYLSEDARPADALTRLNRFVCATATAAGATATEVFIALLVAVVDPGTGRAEISVAGAEPPCVHRAGDAAHAALLETLPPENAGLPIGIEPGEEYTATELSLRPGDTLVLLTDGIIEARGGTDGTRMFGYEGVSRAVREGVRRGADSPERLGASLLTAVRAFAVSALQDDACLVLARFA